MGIKKKKAIDIVDSVGSNIIINYKKTAILRILPSVNDSLNEEWISDKTRFFFDALNTKRVRAPLKKRNDGDEVFVVRWRNIFFSFFMKLLDSLILKRVPSEILIACGNNADIETTSALKSFSYSLSGPFLVSENVFNLNSNIILSSILSTTFQDILRSDLCLLFGTNPRMEASLLNVRLKKRKKFGFFPVVRFGLQENLSYKTKGLGISVKNFSKMTEGNFSFCNFFSKKKRPFLILGQSLSKQLTTHSLMIFLPFLFKNTKIMSCNWFGYNFLPITANFVGQNFFGLNHTNTFNDFSKVDFFLGASVDNPENFYKFLSKDCFSTMLCPYDFSIRNYVNLILPTPSFLERDGSFVNLEGRLQTIQGFISAFSLARLEYSFFLKIFSKMNMILKNYSIFKKKKQHRMFHLLNILSPIFLEIHFNHKRFSNRLIGFKKVSKMIKTPLKGIIFDFFKTNIFSKNSQILSKCSIFFRQNFKSFL